MISRWSSPRKPQRKPSPARRMLRLVLEAGVVQAQLAERVAQILEIGGVDREHAAEHHRLRRPEARQRRRCRPAVVGDRVADPGVRQVLDARGDEADLARPQTIDARRLGVKAPTWSTWWTAPVPIMRTFLPLTIVPSLTRTRMTTPR